MNEKRPDQITKEQIAPAADRPSRVLIAEDDPEMRKMLAWSLHRKGYEVIECQDGNSLMKQLGFLEPFERSQDIHLIISDIRMPGVTGLQVLESAKEFEGFPPMILITAFPDQETRDQAQRLGAVAMFEKPFDIHDLLAKVAQIVPPHLALESDQCSSSSIEQVEVQFPLEIVFRHGSGTESIKAFVREMATELNRFSDRIMRCWVVIDESNPHHPKKHRHHVNINLAIPGKTVVVKRDIDTGAGNQNLYLAIRISFGMAYRQLKTYLGKCDRNRNRSRFKKGGDL